MKIQMDKLASSIFPKLVYAAAACLVATSLLAIGINDASAQRRGGGGGGGGRLAQSSISGANRPMAGGGNRGNINAGNRDNINAGNRNNINAGNRNNINVGNRNNINIDIDGGYNHGCCRGNYHPIAAGIVIGAVAVGTAAALGSQYYALPPSGCSIVYRHGVSYHYCGSVYYQQTYSGNSVVYVVVTP